MLVRIRALDSLRPAERIFHALQAGWYVQIILVFCFVELGEFKLFFIYAIEEVEHRCRVASDMIL